MKQRLCALGIGVYAVYACIRTHTRQDQKYLMALPVRVNCIEA